MPSSSASSASASRRGRASGRDLASSRARSTSSIIAIVVASPTLAKAPSAGDVIGGAQASIPGGTEIADIMADLDSAALAGHFEAQHRRRHRDVEALGPAGVADRHPLVDRASSASPCASLPTTTATRPGRSASVCAVASVRRRADRAQPETACTDVERRVEHRHPEQRTGCARDDLGLNGSTDPGVSTTPSTPAASAERRIVPRLPGSARRSATSDETRPSLRSSAGVRHRDDGEDRLRRLGRRDTLDHIRRESRTRRTPVDGRRARRRRTRPRPPTRRRPLRRRAARPSTTNAPSSQRELRRPRRRRSR